MRLLLALAAAGAAYWYFTRERRRVAGSNANASEAVDDVELSPNTHEEEILDAGVKETFPASDPVSVSARSETAWERQQRGRR